MIVWNFPCCLPQAALSFLPSFLPSFPSELTCLDHLRGRQLSACKVLQWKVLANLAGRWPLFRDYTSANPRFGCAVGESVLLRDFFGLQYFPVFPLGHFCHPSFAPATQAAHAAAWRNNRACTSLGVQERDWVSEQLFTTLLSTSCWTMKYKIIYWIICKWPGPYGPLYVFGNTSLTGILCCSTEFSKPVFFTSNIM